MAHPLHKLVGDYVTEYIKSRNLTHYKIIKDPACGTNVGNNRQNIPLFCSSKKSNKTEYCNVDVLILRDNKIYIIFEIEESTINPTRICGKFLTSALSTYVIHDMTSAEPIPMSSSVWFIQIMNTSNLKTATSKFVQWENIKTSISNIIPVKGSSIDRYELIYGKVSDFNATIKDKLVLCLDQAFSKGE